MKNSTKIIKWLDHGCFPGSTMFSNGFKYDEIMKILSYKKYQNKDGRRWRKGLEDAKTIIESGPYWCLRRTSKDKLGTVHSMYYIIFTDPFTFTDRDYCTLAHEIVHLCQFVLPDILDRNAEPEAEAYFHTYIMEKCLKILRDK